MTTSSRTQPKFLVDTLKNVSVFAKGITELSPEDSLTLVTIAAQCPLQGGTAVYSARYLFDSYLDSPMTYDDITACAKQGIAYRNAPTAEVPAVTYTMQPNPSSGYVQVLSSEPFRLGDLVQVIDMHGRVVSTQKIREAIGLVELELSNAPNGVYSVRLISEGVVVWQSRLVLIKD